MENWYAEEVISLNSIFIFGGTSEGREISDYLCKLNVEHRLFVATEYGEEVLGLHNARKVAVGRLGVEELKALFYRERPRYIIDATHPYAVDITTNIKKALIASDLLSSYVRVDRNINDGLHNSNIYSENIIYVDSTNSAIEYLEGRDGNILLTTGAKSLLQFCSNADLFERIYARILPGLESLELAKEAGLTGKKIIAMEGPFSAALNEALIREYAIKYLVTKESGNRGGYYEKLEACDITGIEAVVIKKQAEDNGIGVEECKAKLKEYAEEQLEKCGLHKVNGRFTIVGIGVGNTDLITELGLHNIREADIIIAAKRMLEYGKSINENAQFYEEYLPDKVLEICKNNSGKNISILVSGDTGFYSGAVAIKDKLLNEGYEVKLIPGISSISYFASLLGISYSDTSIVSMHGRECDIETILNENRTAFAIVSGYEDVCRIYAALEDKNTVRKMYVGYNLGAIDEKVFEIPNDRIESIPNAGLYVVCVE